MNSLLYSLGILIISGILSLWLNRFVKLSNAIGAMGAVIACIVGLWIFFTLHHCNSLMLNIPWPIPFGSFSIAIDFLGLVFLLPIFILCALSALYGYEYLKRYYGKKNIGSAWFFYNLLVASMILVVLARNAILFLLAWEIMSISSFFLVLFEGEKKEVARAGILYLIATHIGMLFLLVMFILLGQESGSFDFANWKIIPTGFMPSIIFICAVIGFGTKAGFMPVHIWLPEAHPAAPSHVSAVMSGVMIKTGIYGIVRILTFLGPPLAWWGYLLIAIGIVSAILGVLFALAQHDLKRLLAYSSIENIGIISIGLGLGILGISLNNPVLAVIGFTSGLLHVINHAFFKGLLFLGSGAVWHETGTRKIDVLGGLLKKMPVTGFCFLIGAAAICGLPPLNGFISEFLILFASYKGILGTTATVFISLGIIASLALIGSLAIACFTEAFGIIFLGEPRSAHGDKAHEPGALMLAPMAILAGLCVLIGLGAPFIINLFARVILEITGMPVDVIHAQLSGTINPLSYIVAVSLLLYCVFLLLMIIRRVLLQKREIRKVVTWDCGYARPNPRMQYTASSFAEPIINFFKGVLRTHKSAHRIDEYFPDSFTYKTKTLDVFSEFIFRPVSGIIHRAAGKLTWVQHGQLQIYVLYIFITLVALFIWKL
ncbi:MAG: proton-conducting transporter membrane subunit [Chlamydiota bacterium]|nr:proton-conducting transporter membrane subunit [Chlamydiota bacterium]